MRNPLARAHRVLGITDANWTSITSAVRAYLTANEDKEEVDEATVRALHPALANERVWNEAKRLLGIT